ncbi:MAG: sigma-70 family RNA polymerase sigma factor [Bacteroidota bacterium]
MEEKELVQACKRKKQAAQKQLYERYYEIMFRTCFRYLGNSHDSEDIVVEGFLKIFEHIKKFEYRNSGSLKNWMKTIMINESLMHLRKNKRILFSDDEYILEQKYHIDETLEIQDIHKAIAQMPIGYRTVFNMYVVEGYSHKEIAESLNISEQTSKSQLSRAKKFLQKMIKDLNYERQAI